MLNYWKTLPGTNALAYFASSSATNKIQFFDNSSTPGKSNNRLSTLFSNMKIPKLRLSRKQTSGGSKSGSPPSASGSPASADEVDKKSPPKTLTSSKSENIDLVTIRQNGFSSPSPTRRPNKLECLYQACF